MKKILLSLVAIAAAVFATSCTNDLLNEGVKGNTVALTISTPELATRAYGNGEAATYLYYAVYEGGTLLTEISKIDTPEKLVGGQKTVYLTLAQGLEYEMIFWAGSTEGFGTLYNVDFAAKTMTLQPAALKSQDENLDAFYTRLTGRTIENLEGTTVELKRPFSQLNISVSNEDLEAARKANLVVGKTLVEVKTPTVLNLENGEATGETVVTYALADAANVAGYPKAGYHQLAMNYLLANASKSLVNVTFSYTRDGSDTVINTREFGNVPVQRNFRTNIYGDILTKNIGFTVDLQESWEEITLPNEEGDKLILAGQMGGEYTLTANAELTSTLEVTADMVINLNGKTLTGDINVANGVNLEVNNGTITNTNKSVSGITSNGNLTLNDVEITSARHAVRVESGKVVINGGRYTVNPVSSMTIHALNVGDNGTVAEVIIKGGTFIGPKGTSADSGSAVNVRAGSKVTIEGGDFSKGKNKTLANGGELIVKGGLFDQQPNAAWLADGYKVMSNNGKYAVVPEEADAVASTDAELVTALQNVGTVYVAEGEYTFPANSIQAGTTIVCEEGTVFTGQSSLNINGATVIGATFANNEANGNAVKGTVNGTFKNCTFEGHNTLRYCYAGADTISFEGCVFKGQEYAVHFDSGTNKTLKFKDCVFHGTFTNGVGFAVEVENCEFHKDLRGKFNIPNFYDKSTVINSKFVFDGTATKESIRLHNANDDATKHVFTNCTVNGNPLKDHTQYLFEKLENGDKFTIDDQAYVFAKDAEGLKAALNAANGGKVILADGEYVGKFYITDKNITLEAANKHKATIKGRVGVGGNATSVATFKGLNFEVTAETDEDFDFSTNVNKTTGYVIGNYCGNMTVVDCNFSGMTDDCGAIQYGSYQSGGLNGTVEKLIVKNCSFDGGRAIRSRSNVSVTDCEFKGLLNPCLQVVGLGDYDLTSTVEFKNNTSDVAVNGVTIKTSNQPIKYVTFDVSGNTNCNTIAHDTKKVANLYPDTYTFIGDVKNIIVEE